LYRKYNKKELDEGKIENIKIAVQSLNEIIVPPGKVFSFWKFVGRPSAGKGFKNGLVLSDGTLKEDMGGGLCQLSNLIAYMFACTECEFVERKHHSRDVFPDSGRSVPFASGATVFFNLIDLKIKNTYSFPIKINLHVTETQLRGSVSAPCSLGYFVKLEEKEACFIRSAKTNCIYRCNELYRVFYTKGIKQKMRESLLWKNVAKVIYEEKDIKSQIYTL
jgi:vancomycin resistance protein VanW